MKLSQLKNTIKELIKEQLGGGIPAQLDPITPTYVATIKCPQGMVPVEIHPAGSINTPGPFGQIPTISLTRPVGTDICFTCKKMAGGTPIPSGGVKG
jgi:hypothetical protein